jgi:predicted nucleic acid-binding protein
MEPPRVYIETTIPSAYFDERPAPEMIRRREATRRWWADAVDTYALVTSSAVREELEKGPLHSRTTWLDLIKGLRRLRTVPAIETIALSYQQHKLMPADDAFHLALASFYRCDFLVTWDRKHLANPNKFRHIHSVNTRLRLFVPRIVSPSDLLGGDHA